jgi:transposase
MTDHPGAKHHLPAAGRSWELPPAQQNAIQAAKHEQRLENVQMLQDRGYSQSAIAQALKVDRKTIYRDLQEISQRHMLENALSLPEQLDRSLQRKEFLYQQAVEVITDKRILPKDRVAANDVATKLVRAMDEQQGLLASERVTTAALGELYQVMLSFVEATGQQHLFTAMMAQRLQGTPQGALVLGILANNTLYIDEGDPELPGSEEASESNDETENEGEITDNSTNTLLPSR